MLLLRVYRAAGTRVRGFIPSVLDWEEGLIVSYPRYIITDRMLNRPGSYRLWVSVIRVVCPVNVGRLDTFEYEFMLGRTKGWKKKLMCAWHNITMNAHVYCGWTFWPNRFLALYIYYYYYYSFSSSSSSSFSMWCLGEILIFKPILLVYSLWKLTLLTYPTFLLFVLPLLRLLPQPIHYIPLYCRTPAHALFVLYTRLPPVTINSSLLRNYDIIQYLILAICFRCVHIDSCDAIIMHLATRDICSKQINK